MKMFKSSIKTLFLGLTSLGFLSTGALASNDLLAHWRLDDGTGTEISDSSGNENIGFAKNVKWVQGVHNTSAQVSGGGINCGNDFSLNAGEQLSMDAWIKPWNPNYPQYPTIVAKRGSYALALGPNKTLVASIWIDGKEHQFESKNTEWPNGKWMHVAAVYNGNSMKIYVNGKLDNESPATQGDISDGPEYCHIGSINGKRSFIGTIDEVRLSASVLSKAEVDDLHFKGRYEIQRRDSQFSPFFSKREKRVAKALVPGTLWIDTEDFDDYGGWWMDTQFVPEMGSPYLIACGIGEPVDDATTTIQIEEAGNYKLWVRNRNWIKEHAPGTFNVSINGQVAESTFGNADSSKWIWQDGGNFSLEKGAVSIALSDLTGFYGRCDALVLTKDEGYVPPQEQKQYKAERDRHVGVLPEEFKGHYEVVVVGAGAAGCNAAIAAARSGAKTVLIQNRPMVGGNNSSELGVPILGPADFGKPNAREAGLNEEIGREHAFNFLGKWATAAELVASREPNLTIFLNTHVYDAEMEGKTIKGVKAFDMIDDKRSRFTGDVFIDCTGDGWLGYFAGAEYMMGREAKDTFGESNAPDEADGLTMSGSIFSHAILGYQAKDLGEPYTMETEDWYWDLTFNTTNLQARQLFEGTYKSGTWWHENRNNVDDLWDPEGARDGLIRVSLSYYNWIKNHSNLGEKAKNYKLRFIPITNAKRETRRLVGDHIFVQDEATSAKLFEDRIGYFGWGLDIHHPDAIFSTEGPFDFNTHIPIAHIPYRMLYSKNISNMFMAGRDVSCSHVALGTARVQGTTGQMGQAVGTAAAMCVRLNTTPRGIYQNHMKALQQQLLKDDQTIFEMPNEDPNDLARTAQVTASSVAGGNTFGKDDVRPAGTWHDLNQSRAVMFRRGLDGEVSKVFLLLKSTNAEDTEIKLSLRGSPKFNDYSSTTDIRSASAKVPANSESWVEFDLSGTYFRQHKFIFLALPAAEGIAWSLMETGPAGSSRAYFPPSGKKWNPVSGQQYAYHLDYILRQAGGSQPESVINGINRIVGDELNMWMSDPKQALPQHLTLDLGKKKTFNTIYLTFDTNFDEAKHTDWQMKEEKRFVPESVRDYQVQVLQGDKWATVVEEEKNYQRRRIHQFPATEASQVRVVVNKTNGDPSARIFEVRLYNE